MDILARALANANSMSISDLSANKANKTQEAWITPTLLNGATQDATYPFQYYKDTIGLVHCKGRFTTPATEANFVSLPTGYKTIYTQYYTVPYAASATTTTRIDVIGNAIKSYVSSTKIDMSGVSFRAEA